MKVGGYKLSALEIEAVLLEASICLPLHFVLLRNNSKVYKFVFLFLQHPVVSECCILGLPDKDYGEAVCAIIVPKVEEKKKREQELCTWAKEKPAISLEELRTWAEEKVAPYKVLQLLQNENYN